MHTWAHGYALFTIQQFPKSKYAYSYSYSRTFQNSVTIIINTIHTHMVIIILKAKGHSLRRACLQPATNTQNSKPRPPTSNARRKKKTQNSASADHHPPEWIHTSRYCARLAHLVEGLSAACDHLGCPCHAWRCPSNTIHTQVPYIGSGYTLVTC